MRAFQCQAGAFDAKVESSGADAVAAVLAGEKAVSTIEVTVPAEKLDCRNGTMNEHMRKALKAKEFPTVVFRATSYDLARTSESVGVTLNGSLTLGGVEKPITVNAQAKPAPTERSIVAGTREVRMTRVRPQAADPHARHDEGRREDHRRLRGGAEELNDESQCESRSDT